MVDWRAELIQLRYRDDSIINRTVVGCITQMT